MDFGLPVTTTREEADRDARIAVLPVGSFEQHGEYLPLSTDTFIANIIAQGISSTYNLMLLPAIPISCSHEHAGWPGTVSITSRTLHSIISDIRDSLSASGVKRLLIVNGHGGNYILSNIVQEASIKNPNIALFPSTSDWTDARRFGRLHTLSGHTDMHAGELETSILLAFAPKLVRRGFETSDHLAENRPHLLSLGMREYTESGVIGTPSHATPKKGEEVMQRLMELARGPIEILNRGENSTAS